MIFIAVTPVHNGEWEQKSAAKPPDRQAGLTPGQGGEEGRASDCSTAQEEPWQLTGNSSTQTAHRHEPLHHCHTQSLARGCPEVPGCGWKAERSLNAPTVGGWQLTTPYGRFILEGEYEWCASMAAAVCFWAPAASLKPRLFLRWPSHLKGSSSALTVPLS